LVVNSASTNTEKANFMNGSFSPIGELAFPIYHPSASSRKLKGFFIDCAFICDVAFSQPCNAKVLGRMFLVARPRAPKASGSPLTDTSSRRRRSRNLKFKSPLSPCCDAKTGLEAVLLYTLSKPLLNDIKSAMPESAHKGLSDIVLEIVELTPPTAPISDNSFAARVEVAMSRTRAGHNEPTAFEGPRRSSAP
jgi:hypothetical protein